MILYIFPFLLTLFAAFKYDILESEDGHKAFIWKFLYIYLVSVIGLRYMVGGDSYFICSILIKSPLVIYLIYHGIKNINHFFLLTSFAKFIYPDFTSFQIIHALIINSCLFWFISKHSKYKFSTLFYVY